MSSGARLNETIFIPSNRIYSLFSLSRRNMSAVCTDGNKKSNESKSEIECNAVG